METWLSFLRKQPEKTILRSPKLLAELFTLDLNNPQIPSIQSSLVKASEVNIGKEVDKAQLLDDEWPGIIAMARAYLIWCAFINPQDPKSNFAQYAAFYIALQQAYANYRGSCLNLVVRNTTLEIYRIFGNSGKIYLEWFASGVLKLFNAIRSEREPPTKNSPYKRENAVFYANMISRAYFKSGQFVSAGNVFSNMYSIGISMSNFSKSEQVEYRFWLGRYYLYRNDVEAAFIHLNWAFEHVPTNTSQFSLILEWLVVPSILVGRLPRFSVISPLIQSQECKVAIESLAVALRSGKIPSNYDIDVEKNPWVISHHLRPALDSNMPLLVRRSGLKRLIRLSGTDKLPLRLIRTSFHLSPEADPELLITENICETLISRGMLKGSVLPVSQMLVIKSQGSVPALLEVNRVLDRNLPERDNWLQK